MRLPISSSFCFKVKQLGPSTIEGYRSAINSVWHASGRSLAGYHIDQLLKSFRAERPRSVITFPKWDLALVMRVLSKPPFEPLASSSPKNLTRKTVFLLLMATARRCGDIHAIDPSRVTFTRNAAILEPYPGYLPKVRNCAEGQERYQPIVVKSLSAITADPEELVLCPVRALKIYDEYARKKNLSRNRFFETLRSSGKVVCKNTVSSWVVSLIRDAYHDATESDARLCSLSTHEIRAISASLAHQATFALSDILATATWSNPNNFISHYLRNGEGLQGKLHMIAPGVVASKTLR